MPARNVDLTDHLEAFVDESVSAGHFESASEVVRAGLHLLEERQAEHRARLERLKAAIDIGLEDAREGRIVSVPDGGLGRHLAGLGKTGAKSF